LFGYGSIIVSGGILALGVVILLPKVGVVLKFPTRRILALEIGFLALMAILHLATGDPELRAVARAGHGGGIIGWALSAAVSWIFGAKFALLFYIALLVVCLAVIAGISRTHIKNALKVVSERLQSYAEKNAPPPKVEASPVVEDAPVSSDFGIGSSLNGNTATSQGLIPKPTTPLSRRASIMRIRPNPENIPPSLRASGAGTFAPSAAGAGGAAVNMQDSQPSNLPDEPMVVPRTIIAEFNAIGKLLDKKEKGEQGKIIQMVERPDGRIKRYFTVAEMKEPKRMVKRDKALPPLTLLQEHEIHPPDEEEVNRNVVLIENTLLEFDIDVDVVDVKIGPTVTQYAVQPFKESKTEQGETFLQRTRLSKIAALAGDLTLSLSAKRLRLETPVPGHSYMGVEVPNRKPSVVGLRSVFESRYFFEDEQKARSPLYVPLGRDVSGAPLGADLGGMPHLLIAGTTGSGKSVCIAALATALILNNTPDKIKLIMLDPKMVELSRFNGLPHLLGPVETDQERIIGVLRWCTREMDRRYKLLEENAARNIDIFNSRLGRRRQDEYLPYIVILVDEIGDLMMTRPDETEKTITRLAQMARAVGMHLVVATQRPSVDVITGLIKANFPSRISFAVASGVDSRVILDTVGAETLLGRGDMLYLAADAAGPRRLQGCYVSDDEVRSVVQYWKDWADVEIKAGRLAPPAIAPWERGLTRREFLSDTDPMLEDAIELVIKEGEASASLIQRKLGLGYPRAARMIDLLEQLGVIGEPVAGGRNRKVLIKPGKDPFKEILEKRAKGKL
jgi:S-DNA-T family DNA segregation ATPase FtsK/SpoIIIE